MDSELSTEIIDGALFFYKIMPYRNESICLDLDILTLQPLINPLPLESPLPTNLDGRDPLGAGHAVDGCLVYAQHV